MNRTLITNIKGLVQANRSHVIMGADMKELPIIENAWLMIEGEEIAAVGHMDHMPHSDVTDVIDATNRFVFPAYCDSHTHIVFAGSRESEFVDRVHGLTYEEIANRGGGILNSAKRLQNTSEEELFDGALSRIHEMMMTGTGAIEIKSGYGLSYDAELKMLRVIKRLKETADVKIKATFLGAHAFPAEFKENRSA